VNKKKKKVPNSIKNLKHNSGIIYVLTITVVFFRISQSLYSI